MKTNEATGYQLHFGLGSLCKNPVLRKHIIYGIYPRAIKAEHKQSAIATLMNHTGYRGERKVFQTFLKIVSSTLYQKHFK